MKEEAPGAPEREEPAEKLKVRVVRNEVTVKEKGESRTIAGRACKEWVITWVVGTEKSAAKLYLG